MKLTKEKASKSCKMDKEAEATSTSTLPPKSEELPESGEGRLASSSSLSSSHYKESYWSVVASLSFLCTGLLRAYTSPALLSIQNENGSRNNSNHPVLFPSSISPSSRNDLISWIASIAPLASFLGTILSGPCLDQLGRRQTLFILTLPSFIGWILVGSASSISSLLLGRALTGFSVGLATATAPLYISEVCQSQQESSERKGRGWLGLLPGILLATGILLGFLLADQFQEWRKLAQVISFFPFLLCVLSLTIPESPSWLMGRKKKIDELEFDLEMEQVVPPPSTHQSTKSNLSEKTGLLAKQNESIFLSLILPISIIMILQQFSGANVLIFYLSEILTKNPAEIGGTQAGGFFPDPMLVHQASLIIGLVQFIGFLLALPLIDYGGGSQRSLLIISAILMSLAHMVLAVHFHLPLDHSDKPNDSWTLSMIIRVSSLSALFCCYSIGLGPIPFLFIQLFSDKTDAGKQCNKVKSYISSVASLVNHLALFVVVKGFPYLFHVEGYGPSTTFWIFAGVCWSAAIFTFYFVPVPSTPSSSPAK